MGETNRNNFRSTGDVPRPFPLEIKFKSSELVISYKATHSADDDQTCFKLNDGAAWGELFAHNKKFLFFGFHYSHFTHFLDCKGCSKIKSWKETTVTAARHKANSCRQAVLVNMELSSFGALW